MEPASAASPTEPQPHWREVARLAGGDIQSWETARARRGPMFERAFASRPLWGSAASAAADAGRYSRIYALDEDVGFKLALLLRARGWKGRFVCLVHQLSPKRRQIVELLGTRVFGHFVTYTDVQREALLASGVDPSRITSAPIPTDTAFFAPKLPGASLRPRFVAIGAADRDYATLFAAAPSIAADIEVFGHGYAGRDAAGLKPADIPPNVRLMPHMSVDALRDRMASATGAILPLKTVGYAAGATVLIETMSCGLPMVVTRIPGISDYLSDGRPGPAVPPGDPGALAAAATALLSDPAAARALGQANRDWVLAHANVDAFAARIVSLLDGKDDGGRFWS